MTIYSIYNNKGGVGKTTTTLNLVKALELQGKNVLVIDIDPQGNTTQAMIGEKRDEIEFGIEDVLLNDVNFDEALISINESISLIGNTSELQHTANKLLMQFMQTQMGSPQQKLKNKINESKKISKYDYVFIDCPPTVDLLVNNALSITDKVIVPILADNFSKNGLKIVFEYIDSVKKELNPNIELCGIFLNSFRSTTKLHQETYNAMNLEYSKFLNTTIPISVKIQESSNYKVDLPQKLKSKYKDLLEEILGEERIDNECD